MTRALPHLIGFILPPLIILAARLGGAWTFLPLTVVYVLLPVADRALNPDNPAADDLAANPWFRAITWSWVPIQIGLVVWVLRAMASGQFTTVELAGLTLSLGVTTGGIGITFAHELIHRAGRFERALGEMLLASVLYLQFAIEHVYGHHRHVGTPRDPATARYGESIYRFVVRSLAGGAVSAWRIEVDRLRKRRLPAWRNCMIGYAAIEVGTLMVVAWAWGWTSLAMFVAQAGIAVGLLEIINYIEHYGLFRREVAPGRYERIEPWHSWNSSHRVSNWVLINLARHADHHLTASKRYQVLHTLDAAPQLPAGYSAMMLLALVPPLWRRVMDPRVESWRTAHLGPAKPDATGDWVRLKAGRYG